MVNDDDSNIRFKTTTIRSILCDYSNAYILVKGTITLPKAASAGAIGKSINNNFNI